MWCNVCGVKVKHHIIIVVTKEISFNLNLVVHCVVYMTNHDLKNGVLYCVNCWICGGRLEYTVNQYSTVYLWI